VIFHMSTRTLRIVFVFCLVLLSFPAIHDSFGMENQRRQQERFVVSENGFHLVVEKGLISLESHEADLDLILSDISKGMGIRIERPANFDRKVSTTFQDLPLDVAFKKLVRNWGIAFSGKKRQGGQQIYKAFCLAESPHENKMKDDNDRRPATSSPHQNTGATLPIGAAANRLPGEAQPVAHPNKGEPASVAPHELVVKFRTSVSKDKALDLIQATGASIKSQIEALGYYVLSLPPDLTVNEALGIFQKHDAVERVEPNYRIPIKMIPNDPDFPDQWALNNTGQNGGTSHADIDATAAWDLEEGNEGVIIAVVDTGVDYTHPDLSPNIWHNPGEIPGNGIDDDGNGYVDDTIGWDFVDATGGASGEDYQTPDNDPMDRDGHGTHVAGIIGAVANNGIGIAGVAGKCKIMVVRAGYKTPSGDGILQSADAAQAIIYAADNGARVINLSWGDSRKSGLIEDAITFATKRGALICAAAGNENTSSLVYPAASENNAIIAVGATDSQDRKASFSNFGDWVDVFAPGVAIYSTYPGNSYREMNGTSMATPEVSGLAALLFSYLPELTPAEIKARIMRSADVQADLAGDSNASGRINAYNALTAVFVGPHIFSLNPTAAHEGDQISIFGDGFGKEQGNGSVIFDSGQKGAIISWSNTVIVCRVPEGTQSGGVTVSTLEGKSNSCDMTILPRYYNETLVENAFLGRGEAQGWQADDQSWTYQLPFTFPFYGRLYDTVHISSNGLLYFSAGAASYAGSAETLKQGCMIAPLWDDLVTNGFSQQGEDIYIHRPSPDSICIRWKAERYETRDPVNVEVVLHQDGRIVFNYGSGNTNLSPTIGISGGDGSQYRLASYDGKSRLTQVQTVLFTPLKQSFTIKLNPGWNLISLPIEPSSNQVSQIMGSMTSNIESMWGFIDGAWQEYVPGDPGMTDLAVMKSGYGYWVNARKGGIFQVQGEVKATPLDLTPGWHLIGIRSLKNLPVEEALAAIDGDVYSVWTCRDGTWQFYSSQSPGLSDLEEMAPGIGYWVKIQESR
jgi:subtilisin family serine protease